jgi:hypothetical protein
MGRPLVPVLRLSLADKAKEPEVQGEAEGKDKEARAQGSQANHGSRKISQWTMSQTFL